MSTTVRYVLLSIVGTAMAAILIVTYFAGERAWRDVVCQDMKLEISSEDDNIFVWKEDLGEIIENTCGAFTGEHSFTLDTYQIEQAVKTHSAVKDAQAWKTKDGELHISVEQKKPVLRFQSHKYGFYAQKDGSLFPLQERQSADVPLIEGEFPFGIVRDGCPDDLTSEQKQWVKEAIALSEYIQNDPVWKSRISQIHSDKNGSFILSQRDRKENFIFGAAREIPQKFKRLELYHKSVGKSGASYSEVDLRFDKMLICRK
ncbi:MAG: hypothetical protein MJY67_01705 [Bacteroidales bacterium]|nr:hypothetical protein [Bacteroidales bacterium]